MRIGMTTMMMGLLLWATAAEGKVLNPGYEGAVTSLRAQWLVYHPGERVRIRAHLDLAWGCERFFADVGFAQTDDAMFQECLGAYGEYTADTIELTFYLDGDVEATQPPLTVVLERGYIPSADHLHPFFQGEVELPATVVSGNYRMVAAMEGPDGELLSDGFVVTPNEGADLAPPEVVAVQLGSGPAGLAPARVWVRDEAPLRQVHAYFYRLTGETHVFGNPAYEQPFACQGCRAADGTWLSVCESDRGLVDNDDWDVTPPTGSYAFGLVWVRDAGRHLVDLAPLDAWGTAQTGQDERVRVMLGASELVWGPVRDAAGLVIEPPFSCDEPPTVPPAEERPPTSEQPPTTGQPPAHPEPEPKQVLQEAAAACAAAPTSRGAAPLALLLLLATSVLALRRA